MAEAIKKSIPELAVDTRLLYQALLKLMPGELITYAALSALIGRDVRGKAGGNLYSARRKALSDGSIVTEAVFNLGIKRLANDEIPELGDAFISKIHSASRRTAKKLVCVDYGILNNESKIKHSAAMSMVGAISQATRNSKLAALTSEVRKVMGELPVAKTLELFK